METKLSNKEFDKIFNENYSRLCIYAKQFVSNYSTAEDIVSDAFLKLHLKKDTLNLKFPVVNYLFKIVYNNCIDHLKSRTKSYNFHYIDDIEEVEFYSKKFSYTVDQIIFEDESDGDYKEKLILKLNKAIDHLPSQCKKVIKMRKIEGLSHKVISDHLKISKKTVETQIYRGIKKIKASLLLIVIIYIFNMVC